jgi:type II secretory pathway pseudopilin PulG
MPSPSTPAAARGESGYNLVVLVIIITVMNIMVAAALPLWSSMIQRDKEEELIFRGLQYAEAIRVFQNKQSRLPVRLEELIEVEPRAIRQLWKDPMTEDGKWQLIFQNMGGGPLTPGGGGDPGIGGDPGERPRPRDDDEEGGENDGRDDDDSTFGPSKGEVVAVGPIIGVRSRSGKASFITFNGKQRYDEWQFTINLLNQPRPSPTPAPGGFDESMMGRRIDLSNRWIGRPLPPYLTQGQPQDGNLPTDPNQLGPNPRKPTGPGAPGNRRRPSSGSDDEE